MDRLNKKKQGSRTVRLLSIGHFGAASGRRHGRHRNARPVHVARHRLRRVRFGRLFASRQDRLLRPSAAR